MVEGEAKRVDASGSNSTRVLSDVDNFSKNVLQALHSGVSCHDEL